MKFILTLLLLSVSLIQTPPQTAVQDLDVQMMRATFRIEGPSAEEPGKIYTGTGFFIRRPSSANPNIFHVVAVTAAHLFKGISGDSANFIIRVKDAAGVEQRVVWPVSIRSNERPLWAEPADADVAALYCPLPVNKTMLFIPIDVLATDETFEKFEFHPGDDVRILGYPFGYEVTPLGYPVLHSARLASFPLIPAKTMGHFIVDFPAFGGNSGGPVYIRSEARSYGNALLNVGEVFSVLGLVTRNVTSPDGHENASLAWVVHAAFIRDAIDLLPPDPK